MSTIKDALLAQKTKLAVVGLGYVGMPLAVAFAEKGMEVIGFDTNAHKIALYRQGIDPTLEMGNEAIACSTVDFTSDETRLKEASFVIVAVPTPVNQDHTPDLTPLIGASQIAGRNLSRGAVVVYESTVYPGTTEEVCIPILERESGLRCGVDFHVGYSPERINPGDQVHRLRNIRKIVSGDDEKTLKTVGEVYDVVIEAGTWPVSSIKTAEAVKVVENSQRDINIAFMNELAIIFDKMGIDTSEVVDGMNTKWNALGFRPGLVGGHCIGVDPFYLTYEAEKLGYHSRIVLAGREVNEGMAGFVADNAIKQMVISGLAPRACRVGVLGITFKENCPDIRNSKAAEVIGRLKEYGVEPIVSDPLADPEEVAREYGVRLVPMDEMRGMDCLIVVVAHDQYRALPLERLLAMFADTPAQQHVLIDVKSMYPIETMKSIGLRHWRL